MTMHMELSNMTAIPSSMRVREPIQGGPYWFAYVAQAGRNEVADKKLQQLGYMTFAPFTRDRKRVKIPGTTRYRVQWVDQPYFGRYSFVALRFAGESLYEVDDADGVQTVWRPGKRPMWIEGPVMDAIMQLGDTCGEMPVTQPDALRIGAKFTVAVGHAFSGFIAELSDLSKLDKTGSIKAWIDVLGSRREVEMPSWVIGEPA